MVFLVIDFLQPPPPPLPRAAFKYSTSACFQQETRRKSFFLEKKYLDVPLQSLVWLLIAHRFEALPFLASAHARSRSTSDV